MKIQITVKTVYGHNNFYPADEQAIKLCNFIKQKTFSEKNIKDMKDMGIQIENVTPGIII